MGRVTRYSYDANNSLLLVDHPTDADYHFQYNPMGWRISMVDATGTNLWVHDLAGRITTNSQFNTSHIISYSFDEENRRTSLALAPMGSSTNRSTYYRYDPAGRASVIEDDLLGAFRYGWDQGGRVSSLTAPNGIVSMTLYDLAGRKMGIVSKSALGIEIMKSIYKLDQAGQRISEVTPSGTNVYRYNSRRELIEATMWDGADRVLDYHYSYDAVGNWLSVDTIDSTVAENSTARRRLIKSNNLNQLVAFTNVDASGWYSTPFSYDINGNMTLGTLNSLESRSSFSHMEYDDENRLTTVSNSVYKVNSDYDANGRRVRRTVLRSGSVETNYFIYDGWLPVGEVVINPSNTVDLKQNLWGLDLSHTIQGAGGVGGLLATLDTAVGAWMYLFDGNGNSKSLVSLQDGMFLSSYSYSPYGDEFNAHGVTAQANRYRFASKFRETETGLDCYGYRFYSPGSGVWPNRDPIGERGGINLYGFVYNNPVNRFDSLGLDANTPSSTITPWELGWEWLTGDGPRHRDFGDGDYMTEELRKHEHVEDVMEKMKTEIRFRCQSCKDADFTKANPYSLAGWGGIFKYLHDYSTLGTGGITGNLVVTYLGSYRLDVTASEIKCAKGSARLSFLVNNSSTAASGTRPPILGYTQWWQNNIAPFVNEWFSSGGMSKTTQTFRWTENATFGQNRCCID